MQHIQLQLYDDNLANPKLIEPDINDYSDLRFTTKLHGGFGMCSFRLALDIAKSYEWAFRRTGYRLVVRDLVYDRTLWEGRLHGSSIGLEEITANAYGYYASMLDDVYTTSYNATPDEVIKGMLTAKCPAISSDHSGIQAMDTARNSLASEYYLDRSPQELTEYLIGLSDSTNQKWYFAIWEDRKPYLFPRDDSVVTWKTRMADLQSFELTAGFENLWNAAYALYRGTNNVLIRTAIKTDASSIARYGIQRTYCIPDLGQVAQVEAEAVRDAWIEEHKEIISSNSDIELGPTVYGTNDIECPSSHVRAGDVILIVDILPTVGDIDNPRRNRINTFYVLETEYNQASHTNRITVDTENNSLDSIMSRNLKY
jgi:hypothetical protein